MKKKIFSIVFILAIISSMFSVNVFASEIADGTYEVNIALWHSEDDKESMAADAIGKKATIVVENGVKTMHITSGEMSMMGIKASLQELRIADAKSDYTDAKVESRNPEGNPTGFYFTMPHTNEYITVKVNPHLAIMGNKDIGARIKVDYSTLKLIKPAETKTETTLIQTNDVSGEFVTKTATVTEIVVVTENVIADNSEDTTTQNTTAVTTYDVTTNVQTNPPEQNNSFIIIIVAIVAVIFVFIIVKIKHKK